VLLYGKREASLEEMYRAVSLSGRPRVIAGEIEGRPIPNAQCGNSPLDFRRPVVTGQTVFYSSTNNGSALQTLITLGRPRRVFWACLLNAPCVARALTRGVIAQPLLFLCAGFRGTLALEDLLTAGQILRIAHHRGFRPEALDDGSQAALAIASLYTSSDGTFIDPALVARHMATWRCGRVLEYMGQAHDVPATVSGQGIAPDLLAAARRCIPTLEAPATDHRIVALDAGVDP
jgi:phosphosulfolactate phosphohydrolase-like enzyme